LAEHTKGKRRKGRENSLFGGAFWPETGNDEWLGGFSVPLFALPTLFVQADFSLELYFLSSIRRVSKQAKSEFTRGKLTASPSARLEGVYAHLMILD